MSKFNALFFVLALVLSGVSPALAATITVAVSWTNPTTGGAITAMHVQRSTDDGTTWTNVSPAFTGNIQQYTDVAAPLTTIPQYRINRCNAVGCSASAVYIPAVSAPDAATNVSGAFTINP